MVIVVVVLFLTFLVHLKKESQIKEGLLKKKDAPPTTKEGGAMPRQKKDVSLMRKEDKMTTANAQMPCSLFLLGGFG